MTRSIIRKTDKFRFSVVIIAITVAYTRFFVTLFLCLTCLLFHIVIVPLLIPILLAFWSTSAIFIVVYSSVLYLYLGRLLFGLHLL